MSAIQPPAFGNFALWYADGLPPNNTAAAQTDEDLKIWHTEGPHTPPAPRVISGTRDLSLIYAIPSRFDKRVTDTSESTAVDKTAPDTGTAVAAVSLYLVQERSSASFQDSDDIRRKLMQMFYRKGNDADFKKGRFGLMSTDCPSLDCTPDATAGYKFMGFRQTPNPDEVPLIKTEVMLEFAGNHTRLGAFT